MTRFSASSAASAARPATSRTSTSATILAIAHPPTRSAPMLDAENGEIATAPRRIPAAAP
jgi:hypothetical protein